jgi:hypothetical protein
MTSCDDVDELISARQQLRPAWRPSIRRRHFNRGLFNGFDFTTMLRIGSMNMALHGVDGANVTHRDSPRRYVAAQARNASPRCNGGAAELTETQWTPQFRLSAKTYKISRAPVRQRRKTSRASASKSPRSCFGSHDIILARRRGDAPT